MSSICRMKRYKHGVEIGITDSRGMKGPIGPLEVEFSQTYLYSEGYQRSLRKASE
ncbi:hypothetical protein SAMN06296036_12119 [Pseudobacteriovorax antillogorgiicola]|uniref:Uncharacterized protein n=1 Tax=Pseudobacteriovorax antillogorgiicola TaxID=1513793 RepID=A0A1Y6CL01_9BACT|nr:hypothetical protein SAMN06296036_12119 [Pseudobacteriovorax antillogorgiicola]